MLIEDVACPVDKLGDMTQDLVDMFQKFGYKDASCFGHALEGNLHLVFSQVSSAFSKAHKLATFPSWCVITELALSLLRTHQNVPCLLPTFTLFSASAGFPYP